MFTFMVVAIIGVVFRYVIIPPPLKNKFDPFFNIGRNFSNLTIQILVRTNVQKHKNPRQIQQGKSPLQRVPRRKSIHQRTAQISKLRRPHQQTHPQHPKPQKM